MEYRFINPEYLNQVSGGDIGIITEIVGMFRDQSLEAYSQMLGLLESNDYHNLGMLAHKVKSSVAIMGMNDLATMLKTFELQAKDSREPGMYRSYIERFVTETKAAIEELEDFVKNYPR